MEEEEKKVSQETSEQNEEQTEALLEPTPYHNKYKRDLDKEETEDTATVQKDTDSQEAATPEEERPVNAEEKVFKKRYDDLKRHYDSTVNKHKDEVSRFRTQLEEKADSFKLPKTKGEIDAWRKKYPDVYDVMETIAYTKADEKSKQVQTKMKNLENAQANVNRDKAEVELEKIHSDFKDIRANDKFHEWVATQDSTIQGWLYDNTNNAKLAARAIDLYKMDAGLTKKAKSVDKKEAAKAVTSTSKRDIEAGEKKIWSVREIEKLKPQQFVKLEKEIDLARREGRIRT